MRRRRFDNLSCGARLLLSALSAVAFVSCAGTEVGNPANPEPTEVQASIEFAPHVPKGTNGALTLDSGVIINEVWMVFDRFSLNESCEVENPTEAMPVVVELIGGAELPAPVELVEPPGNFCTLKMDMRALEVAELPVGAPAELADLSVLVRGRTAEGDAFEITLEDMDTIELRAHQAGGFALGKGRQQLLIAVLVDDWFAHLNFEGTEVNSETGVIEIDGQEDSELLREFSSELRLSFELVPDENGDGFPSRGEVAKAFASSR